MKTATIKMKAGDIAEVLLYDEIGEDPFFGLGISAKTFRDQIKGLSARSINLRINSPGGVVTEGAAMLSALDEFPGRIEVDIDGLAASAASVVAMAGDRIRMGANALMMIHDPHAGVMGGAERLRQIADLLDKMKTQIVDSYRRHSSYTPERIAAMMAAETWMTGAEAVEAGFADEVTEPMRIAAHFDLAKFHYRNAPRASANDAAREELERRKARLLEITAGPGLTHDSKTRNNEPDWGNVDKNNLPEVAYARKGSTKSDWGFPHHWVTDGKLGPDGIYTSGTLWLHRGGLNAAWAAANGAHTGKKAEQAVIDHLQEHRRALGLA